MRLRIRYLPEQNDFTNFWDQWPTSLSQSLSDLFSSTSITTTNADSPATTSTSIADLFCNDVINSTDLLSFVVSGHRIDALDSNSVILLRTNSRLSWLFESHFSSLDRLLFIFSTWWSATSSRSTTWWSNHASATMLELNGYMGEAVFITRAGLYLTPKQYTHSTIRYSRYPHRNLQNREDTWGNTCSIPLALAPSDGNRSI